MYVPFSVPPVIAGGTVVGGLYVKNEGVMSATPATSVSLQSLGGTTLPVSAEPAPPSFAAPPSGSLDGSVDPPSSSASPLPLPLAEQLAARSASGARRVRRP